MSEKRLRFIDFGRVTPLRSQTLWHAIAHGVSAGAPPTLSLMQPDRPYVSIGFHRRLEEVDRETCRRAGIPVYRRMVGGGPVYLDDGQLFFQITMPLSAVAGTRSETVRHLLGPAVDAFRAVGIDAAIEEAGDVVVGDRKICGHGAAQIEQAVVVVGNLITRFDHGAAARIMATPNDDTRSELERLMRRYVAATPTDHAAFSAAAGRHYGTALGLDTRAGTLTDREEQVVERLDAEFVDDDWLRGPSRRSPSVWRVKIKAGVFLAHASSGHSTVWVSSASGRILRARLDDPAFDGAAAHLERAVRGLSLPEGRSVLAGSGCGRLAQLFDDVERAS